LGKSRQKNKGEKLLEVVVPTQSIQKNYSGLDNAKIKRQKIREFRLKN